MDKKSTIFDNVGSEFDLLDRIRVRYQVFANGIEMLSGILIGFSLAKNQDEYERNLSDFAAYLSKKFSTSPYAVSWVSLIKKAAGNEEYEIPIFYQYLDEYRGTKYEELGEIYLDVEQRHFDFERRITVVNMDYPELPLKPPHKIRALRIPNVKVHAFYYDESNNKYYEQCFSDYDRLKSWAKDCFNIDEEKWVNS